MNQDRLHAVRILAIRFFIPLCLAAGAVSAPARRAGDILAGTPAWFEPNPGTLPPEVKFSSHAASGALLVGAGGAQYFSGGQSLRVRFAGANAAALVEGDSPTGARSSYLLGNDPRAWKRGVPHYRRARARDLYPGIDIVWYAAGKQLEYDLVVAPNADPAAVRMVFPGARKPRLDREGDLVFANGLRQKSPAAWQDSGRGRVPVDAAYRVARNGEVSLRLGKYDRSRPLVIDPVLFAAFAGADQNEQATALAVDAAGAVWVTGSSASNITPQQDNPPIQDQRKGAKDVFLARFSPDASGTLTLAYWTQIGGSGDDGAEAIKIDGNGYIFLAGSTGSTDFPRAGTALQTDFGGEIDAFVLEVRPSLSGPDALWYSQFYGGNNTDVATAVDVDPSGAIYIAGYSRSDSLPGAGDGSLQCCNRGGYEGFFAKILPDSSPALAYGTYIGGTSTDVIQTMVVDAGGVIYLAGYTGSSDFPVSVDAAAGTQISGIDGFLLKIDLRKPGLDALIYGSYFGGDALDVPRALAFDGKGGLWMAGYTFSQNFPVTPDAAQSQNAGMSDLFLSRFDLAKLGAPVYSTLLGGSDNDVLQAMALVPGGRIALAGYSYSADFPGAAGASKGADAFVTVLDPSRPGSAAVISSGMLRGSFIDAATGVASDKTGRLFLCGYTFSVDFPVTDGSTKQTPGGLTQSFVVAVQP